MVGGFKNLEPPSDTEMERRIAALLNNFVTFGDAEEVGSERACLVVFENYEVGIAYREHAGVVRLIVPLSELSIDVGVNRIPSLYAAASVIVNRLHQRRAS